MELPPSSEVSFDRIKTRCFFSVWLYGGKSELMKRKWDQSITGILLIGWLLSFSASSPLRSPLHSNCCKLMVVWMYPTWIHFALECQTLAIVMNEKSRLFDSIESYIQRAIHQSTHIEQIVLFESPIAGGTKAKTWGTSRSRKLHGTIWKVTHHHYYTRLLPLFVFYTIWRWCTVYDW